MDKVYHILGRLFRFFLLIEEVCGKIEKEQNAGVFSLPFVHEI